MQEISKEIIKKMNFLLIMATDTFTEKAEEYNLAIPELQLMLHFLIMIKMEI